MQKSEKRFLRTHVPLTAYWNGKASRVTRASRHRHICPGSGRLPLGAHPDTESPAPPPPHHPDYKHPRDRRGELRRERSEDDEDALHANRRDADGDEADDDEEGETRP